MPRVVVFHGYYGCETGCCGHYLEVDDKEIKFEFDHPWSAVTDDDRKKYAEDFIRQHLGEEHVADLDWENSVVLAE